MAIPANEQPLPLEAVAKALAGVTQEDADFLNKLYGIMIANKEAVALMNEYRNPGLAIQRKTARQYKPSEIWEDANRSRRAFWPHFLRHRNKIRTHGEWGQWLALVIGAVNAGWTILRFYASASLYQMKFHGLNHERDVRVWAAWSAA